MGGESRRGLKARSNGERRRCKARHFVSRAGPASFAKLIITLQAKVAQAFAAEAAGNADNAVMRLKEAVTIEDSIDDLSQPPYPVIPAAELSGNRLLDLKRPTEAVLYFRKTLLRTPNRPKAIFGLARAAQALGDNTTARERPS